MMFAPVTKTPKPRQEGLGARLRERLTERHEALTLTVELLAAENRAGFARLERVEEGLARMERGLGHVEGILTQMAQSMDTLARVVELHEHRIDGLENRA